LFKSVEMQLGHTEHVYTVCPRKTVTLGI